LIARSILLLRVSCAAAAPPNCCLPHSIIQIRSCSSKLLESQLLNSLWIQNLRAQWIIGGREETHSAQLCSFSI
jgi:hypothetical protein